jgi:hypothetical protein
MYKRASSALIVCTLALTSVATNAHHAFSTVFDVNKPIVLTGTVTKVEWQNPHTWFYFDVADNQGNVANWGMEMASPNTLIRAGWTRSSMKAGDVIQVDGYQARDGSNIGNAKTVTLVANGKQLLTGSSAGAAP